MVDSSFPRLRRRHFPEILEGDFADQRRSYYILKLIGPIWDRKIRVVISVPAGARSSTARLDGF